MEAHTVEMLVKNDWGLYEFCCSKKNYRDAAASLARIWLESTMDAEKVCSAFARLKLLAAEDPRSRGVPAGMTLLELSTHQLRLIELHSSSEYEEKKESLCDDEWRELAATECKLYNMLNKVFFGREIDYLNKVSLAEDDSFTDDSCESV
jgi:hypothetical protein